MYVRGRADHGVHQSTVRVRARVCFHAKVPLLAFLSLVHFLVPFAVFVLGGAGRGDDGGIHQSACVREQSLVRKILVDQCKYLFGQRVFFQQVTETQDGSLIGHEASTVKTGKSAEGGRFVQLFLRLPAEERLNERDELRLRYGALHLFKKPCFARLVFRAVLPWRTIRAPFYLQEEKTRC